MRRIVLCMVAGLGVCLATPGTSEKTKDVAPEAEQVSVPESPWEPVPEGYRGMYFDKKPEGFLTDPQRLLSPVVRRDRAAFLEYHAGDSSIDLHVYLLGKKQEVPDAAVCDEVIGKFFKGGKASAVVWYPMGAPERAVLHLSPHLRERVVDAEIKRALASSIMQAVEKSDPAGQFEAFLVQMSIRIYWMERLMANEAEVPTMTEQPVEVAVPRKLAEKPKFDLMGKLAPFLSMARPWVVEAAVLAGAMILLMLAIVLSRFRQRHVLPDFSVEPRLGGEHGAGVGAVISFANASVPPALQRGGVSQAGI